MHKFIPISQPSITQKEIDYVTQAVSSGWVSSLGSYIDEFEKKFASFCNTKYALTTSNGTTALHLSLATLNLSPDDEVIVPDFTFIATANAVAYTKAKVVTVDIEKDSLCIDPKLVEKAITPNTKAIIAVHIYGHPANMLLLKQIAKEHDLFLIEDAAESHGAMIDDKKCGSFGDVGVFSFYGNKIMTSGEGGMITTDNKTLYEKLKYLRDHAMAPQKRYWHTQIGFNYRMTNLQAALGVAQLERIDSLLAKKREIFSWYKEYLKDMKNIKINHESENITNVFWMICIEIIGFSEEKRDKLMLRLKENNIDSRPFFYPISDMPMYKDCNTTITHMVAKRGINLPSYYDLRKEDVKYICGVLKGLL
jgi:perosamine synthetase